MNNNYSIDEYISMINTRLSELIPECNFNEDVVHQAMNYSLSIGGKRIRPVLTLEFCRVCHGDINKALDIACAIEMIHTYSLIHDDLPCMDDDDIRRGKPSCHIAFGEEYALLAGDALLTRAFGVVADSVFAQENPAAAVKIISLLSGLSGVNGMIGGQVVDLKNEEKYAPVETLETMDRLKTGALIKCAALMGCICAGADKKKIKAAEEYAEKIGHAFQIVDDILDVTGNAEQLGKPIGSDAQSCKSTYVSLLGLEKAAQYADLLTAQAIDSLKIFAESSEFLIELAQSLSKRKN